MLRIAVAAFALAALPAAAQHGWSEYDAYKPLTQDSGIVESGHERAHGYVRQDRRAASTPTNPVEDLAIAKAMREWSWLYPSVEIVHIVGFTILVGSVVMFDLRVLGLSKRIPVRALSRHLLPWSVGALVLIVPTGLLMFSAHAGDYLTNTAFQLKMALLVTAGLNAAFFHTGPYQSVKAWDTGATAPIVAKLSVILSMILWFAIISCGRLLAYL